MYCKYCEHEKKGSNKLLLGLDKEMINYPVAHHFLCVPVVLEHQVEDFPIPMKETSREASLPKRWSAVLSLLPSRTWPACFFSTSELLWRKDRWFTASVPLAVRTFHVDDFSCGAVSTTFTLRWSTPLAYPLLFLFAWVWVWELWWPPRRHWSWERWGQNLLKADMELAHHCLSCDTFQRNTMFLLSTQPLLTMLIVCLVHAGLQINHCLLDVKKFKHTDQNWKCWRALTIWG